MNKKIFIDYGWNGTGGKIPILPIQNQDENIKVKNNPIIFSNANIYLNNHIIINNNNPDQRFNLNDDFIFEPKVGSDNINFEISLLPNLVNENIIIGKKLIPFHACLIQNKFDIIKKLYQNLTSKYITIIADLKKNKELISTNDIKLISNIFTKTFVLNTNNDDYIGIAAKPNILHKFAFANKFKELLNIIFTNDYLTTNKKLKNEEILKYDDKLSCEILKCFKSNQAYVNLSDLFEITNEYANLSKKDIETDTKLGNMSLKYNESNLLNKDYKSIQDHLKKDIHDIKQLIKFNRIIKEMEDNELFSDMGIGLAELFYCCYIGVRLYNPKLNIGYLSNKILPINQFNFLSNLLGKSHEEIIKITPDNLFDVSYVIYKFSDIIPSYHTYGITQVNIDDTDYQFADCVENTLLQLIKTHCWNSEKKLFDPNYLPVTSIPKLIAFINELNIDNDNTPIMKNKFGAIVSNIRKLDFIYKNRWNYEISSDINNFILILNYLFGLESNTETVASNLMQSRKNPQIIDIVLNGNTIEYKLLNVTINFFINKGHSSHSVTNSKTNYNEYKYINLIKFFTSNYSLVSVFRLNIYRFVSLLNPDKKQFVNFNQLLLDTQLYFLNNIIEDQCNSFDLCDIIYLNGKKFFPYLNLLTKEDFDTVLFKSNFISDTITYFISNDYILQLPKDFTKKVEGKFKDYFPIILDCLKRNINYLIKPNYFSHTHIGITDISKKNLIYLIVYKIYQAVYSPNDILKITHYILDPLFNLIKDDKLSLCTLFLTSSDNNNTLYDLINDDNIKKKMGNYFNDKYDAKFFESVPILKFSNYVVPTIVL